MRGRGRGGAAVAEVAAEADVGGVDVIDLSEACGTSGVGVVGIGSPALAKPVAPENNGLMTGMIAVGWGFDQLD